MTQLSDKIRTIKFAFSDKERKDGIEQIAIEVEDLQATISSLQTQNDDLTKEVAMYRANRVADELTIKDLQTQNEELRKTCRKFAEGVCAYYPINADGFPLLKQAQTWLTDNPQGERT